MIRFTPFDLPFLAGDDQSGGTFAFAFEFRSPQQTHPAGGVYQINHDGFAIDSGRSAFEIKTSGFSGLPAQGIYPQQPMLDGASAMTDSYGQTFNVSGFSALAGDNAAARASSYGWSQASSSELAQQSSTQSVAFHGGAYLFSPDLGPSESDFRPVLNHCYSSNGQFRETLETAFGDDTGTTSILTYGSFAFRPGAEAIDATGAVLTVRGLFAAAPGFTLTETGSGMVSIPGGGQFRDGTGDTILTVSTHNRFGASGGQFEESFALLSQDGGYVLDQDGDPILI